MRVWVSLSERGPQERKRTPTCVTDNDVLEEVLVWQALNRSARLGSVVSTPATGHGELCSFFRGEVSPSAPKPRFYRDFTTRFDIGTQLLYFLVREDS